MAPIGLLLRAASAICRSYERAEPEGGGADESSSHRASRCSDCRFDWAMAFPSSQKVIRTGEQPGGLR